MDQGQSPTNGVSRDVYVESLAIRRSLFDARHFSSLGGRNQGPALGPTPFWVRCPFALCLPSLRPLRLTEQARIFLCRVFRAWYGTAFRVELAKWAILVPADGDIQNGGETMPVAVS